MDAGGGPAHVDARGRLHFWVVKSSATATIARGDWVALEPDCSGVYPVAADVHAQTYEPVTDEPGESGVWTAARDRIDESNQARRDERERIRQLAIKHQATYRPEDPTMPEWTGNPDSGTKPGPDPLGDSFADLLGPGDPQ
jgi:hypothetical protein